MDDLDPRIREFLCGSIASLWTLELLVLLHDRPTRKWSVELANRELRATPRLVAQRLERLERLGLVRREDERRWRYAPNDEAIADVADRLSGAFRARPFSVANALFATPSRLAVVNRAEREID